MSALSKYTQGIRAISEQWPYLRYMGMGAWWAWIWLCYNGVGLFSWWGQPNTLAGAGGPAVVGLMYLYSTSAIAVASLIAAWRWRKTEQLLENRVAVLGISAVACVGVLIIVVAPYAGGDVAFAIGAVFTGLGTSVLAFLTGSVFGTLGRREVLTTGCTAVVFGAFIYFTGVGLPMQWQPVYIMVLPLVSALLFIMPGEDPFPQASQAAVRAEHPRLGRRSFINLVLANVMIAATACFGKGLASTSLDMLQFSVTGSAVVFLVLLGALAICFMVNVGDVFRAVKRVYAALIMLGVAVVALSEFGLDLSYLGVGKELLWMIFTCLMAYMVFRFDFSPVRAFGLGQAAHFVASALFWWAGMQLAPFLADATARLAVVMVMVFAIVAVFAFVFNDSDLKFILTWRAADHAAPEPEAAGAGGAEEPQEDATALEAPAPRTLNQLIAAIPESFGISAREAEIMELFAQGRSANWIAEELIISKNTVRSHIRAIYTKCNVHTRQELLDFLKTC